MDLIMDRIYRQICKEMGEFEGFLIKQVKFQELFFIYFGKDYILVYRISLIIINGVRQSMFFKNKMKLRINQ